MIVYLSSICVSYFIICISKYKKKVYLGLFVSAFILASIAGMRSITVGSDTQIYSNIYQLAKNSGSFVSYRDIYSTVESGYLLLTWIITKMGFSWGGYLFLVNLITNFFVFKSIYILRDKINLDVSVLLYMLVYWLYSLNIMRQSLSMSVILFGIALFLNNQTKLALLIILCGIFFHKSSIVFVGLMVVFLLILKFENNLVLTNVSLVFITLYFLMFRYPILELVKKIGFLGDKYGDYFLSYGVNSGISIVNFLYLLIPFLIFYMFSRKNDVFENKKVYLLNVLLYIGIVMNLLTRTNYIFFFRTALFMLFLQVLYYPYVIKCEKEKNNRLFLTFFIVLYAIVSFFIMFAISNYGELFPYTFE